MSDIIEIRFDPQVTFTPWSTNDDRNKNPYDRAEIISLWKMGAIQAYRAYRKKRGAEWPFPEMKAIVQIEIPFPVNRRRDPHNYCGTVLKAVVDGLVKGGGFPDDTPEYVGHREPVLVVSEDPPRIFIEAEERDDGD